MHYLLSTTITVSTAHMCSKTGDRNAVSLSLTQSDDNKLIPPTRTIVLILLRHGEEEKCQFVIDPSVRSLDRTITLADYYESHSGSQSYWNIID